MNRHFWHSIFDLLILNRFPMSRRKFINWCQQLTAHFFILGSPFLILFHLSAPRQLKLGNHRLFNAAHDFYQKVKYLRWTLETRGLSLRNENFLKQIKIPKNYCKKILKALYSIISLILCYHISLMRYEIHFRAS